MRVHLVAATLQVMGDKAVQWRKEDVRAFRERNWDAFERAAIPLESRTSGRLAADLYEQIRRAQPAWPTQEDRDSDLAAHIRLSETFRRIFDAWRRLDHTC